MFNNQDNKYLPKAPRGKSLCAFFAMCFVVVSFIRIEACPVCFLLPKKTAADFLIESDLVVLARENPKQPFSYSTVEILKGYSTAEEFGLFVDSATRRMLKSSPNKAVVLVRKRHDDKWRSLGIADNEYKEVIKRILAFSDQWTSEGGSQDRYKFFLPLFRSKNRTIFELAYMELGRAPYSTIKKMAEFVSQDDIRPLLHRREYFEWRSLAILMLAQNAGKQDRIFIERSFHDCHRFSLNKNLAAWATAYIELNGSAAVDEIEVKYLRDPNRTQAEIRAIVIALSVHGRNGRTRLRDQIATSYEFVLQNHPKSAGMVVNDLTEWEMVKYHDQLMGIFHNRELEFEPQDATAIQNYLKL